MSATVVGRLHEAIRTTPGPQALARGMVLSMSDAVALDARIAELCPDETACEACGDRICETCGVGELGGCDHGGVYCRGCDVEQCRDCAREIGAESTVYFASDGRLP